MRWSAIAPAPLVRWFARPYVAGGSREDGLATAHERELAEGSLTTLDLLGEGVVRPFQVLRTVAAYEGLIDALARDPRFADVARRPSVSLKPSAFTAGGMDEARSPIREIAARAKERRVALTIDMEDRQWTDRTLTWATDLYRSGHDVGTVLQTRLHRTQADLEAIPLGMRIRLVIGIYPEPASVALTAKPAMKERLLTHAARLLARGALVEMGTHDEAYLDRFLREVAPAAPDRCEIQMLLGVPRSPFMERLRSGHYGVVVPHRTYVPYAESWDDAMAYLRRRMDESPSMMWMVMRNLAKARHR